MSSSDTVSGAPLAFQPVYDEFFPKIRRYLTRVVGPTEAEDLAQEVFAKVHQALPQFRRDSSVATWIYRIATNAAYDRLRSPAFQRAREAPAVNEASVEDRTPGAEQTLVRREMNECIDGYIARLPARYRSALILSEQEDLTNPQIAETLGVSVDTVKIRLHRARARLRKELGSGCDFHRDDRNEFACAPRPRGVSVRD